MLKNYFLIAIRNMMRHKMYSFINIGGLTIGLTACILIALFVQNEASYDSWLPNGERIYRLETTKAQSGKPVQLSAYSPAPVYPALMDQQAGLIEAGTRVLRRQHWVGRDELNLEETISLVDASFFDVFDLPMVSGDAQGMFDDYQSLIISESAARKYFGEEEAIGQVLDLENGETLAKVVAVMKDLPANSHLNIDFLLHLNEARFDKRPHLLKWWMSANVYTYIKMKDAAHRPILEASFPAFLDQYVPTSPGPGYTDNIKASEQLSIALMPVKDIHLYSKGRGQQKPTGDIIIVYSFSAIAVLILTIAVINFANLSSARSSLRAREIALRKTVGATRRQIIVQFLGETFLTTSLALFLALVSVEILLPWFNDVVLKLLSMQSFTDPVVQIGLVGLTFVLAISAGGHPAFNMSSYKPAEVLHSGNAAVHRTSKARTFLTTLQFTISIGLMIATGIIYSQIHYMQTMDIGIDKSRKLTLFHMTYGDVANVANAVEKEIQDLPEVESTTFTTRSFPIRGRWDLPAQVEGLSTSQADLRLEHVQGDHRMLEFFKAKLLAGRFFSEEYTADLPQPPVSEGLQATQSGILNETAIKYLGFPSTQEALGRTVLITQTDDSIVATKIVGVVADIQLRSAREVIDPMVFLVREGPLWILNAHVKHGAEEQALADVDAIWARHVPNVPLDRNFMEDRFSEHLQADKQRGEIFAYFAVLAVFVSSLGLYGLASFTAEQRIREIGVRKVLGAKVSDIVRLLTFQFSKPVLVANLIAWPITWYFAQQWLQGFAFRIDLSPVYFLAAGLLALIIASATVAGHAFRTAATNPISALRHE